MMFGMTLGEKNKAYLVKQRGSSIFLFIECEKLRVASADVYWFQTVPFCNPIGAFFFLQRFGHF